MLTVHFAALLSLLLPIAQATGARAEEIQAATLSNVQLTTYADAVRCFREQRFSAAYGRFARLADAGHSPSAQLALLMYTNGPELFGTDWSATPDQLRRWNGLAFNSARGRHAFVDSDRGD